MTISLESFWWKNITGPSLIVRDVANSLLDRKTVLLNVPDDLPWRKSMRREIQEAFSDRSEAENIVVYDVDAADEYIEGSNPGKFLLSRFAPDSIKNEYRERSKETLQQFILRKRILENRIIWVKGLSKKAEKEWVSFCKEYSVESLTSGLFLLEVHNVEDHVNYGSTVQLDYSKYVSEYDVQVFSSFILDKSEKYTEEKWKKYVAILVASLCKTDSEVAAYMIENVDFRNENIMHVIQTLADHPDFLRRGQGLFGNSDHLLWHFRKENYDEINHRIWSAQLQALYPLIEFERVNIIDRYYDDIADTLNNNDIEQFKIRLYDPMDVEFGTMTYMMALRNGNGGYALYIPDEEMRDRIHHLHQCRNNLAHANPCSLDDVRVLLDLFD